MFCLGDKTCTAWCSNFAPLYDIPEECATGTSNGALTYYLYRYGLVGGNFSYGTAVGFMIALINFGMVYLANMVSRKVADYSLW